MPLAQAFIPAGRLSEEAIDRVVARLTDEFVRCQGAIPGSVAVPELTRIEVFEIPWSRIYVNGVRSPEPVYRIVFKVPIGSITEERKADLTLAATKIILAEDGNGGIGIGDEEAMRVWCMVDEIPDGNWGAGGSIYRWKDILKFCLRKDLAVRRAAKRAVAGPGGDPKVH